MVESTTVAEFLKQQIKAKKTLYLQVGEIPRQVLGYVRHIAALTDDPGALACVATTAGPTDAPAPCPETVSHGVSRHCHHDATIHS